eukprot:Lithocolla_globosa_v1_NODE_1052_length_2913_cov_5.370889.p1 type:complete len:656 gc:universal NODE_1052_length_2913_cov_5.370889:704-2671(+)
MKLVEFDGSEGRGTHDNGAIIDMVFASEGIYDLLGKVSVIPTNPNISDHRLLVLHTEIPGRTQQRTNGTTTKEQPPLARARTATLADVDNYQESFCKTYVKPATASPTVEARWQNLKEGILQSQKVIPARPSRMALLKEQKKRTVQYGSDGRRTRESILLHRKIATEARSIRKTVLRRHIENRMRGLATQPGKRKSRPSHGNPAREEELIKYHQEVGTYKHDTDPQETRNREAATNMLCELAKSFSSPLLDGVITFGELVAALKKQKKGKQGGPDQIPADLLLWLPEEGLMALVDLYNTCLETHSIPKDWAEGWINRVLKPLKDPTKNSSYRPITLLNTAWKTLERIFLNRLVRMGIPEQLFEEQMGFQSGIGCRDQLMVVTEAIRRHDGRVYAAFLDIRKAYDSVWQKGLLRKLLDYGVSGGVLGVVESFYENLRARVLLPGGSVSADFAVLSGTAQGSVLSPLFFNLFINDLIEELNKTNVGLSFPDRQTKLTCGLLADDIALLAKTPEDLQRLLSAAERYAETWHFRFATDLPDVKCKGVIFNTPGPMPRLPKVLLHGVVLPFVDFYDYLGLKLGGYDKLYNMIVSGTLSKVKAYASQQLAQFASIKKPSYGERLAAFTTCTQPKLDYGLEAISLQLAHLQTLQKEEEKWMT